jgi:N-acetylneuraminic acid mutarotase
MKTRTPKNLKKLLRFFVLLAGGAAAVHGQSRLDALDRDRGHLVASLGSPALNASSCGLWQLRTPIPTNSVYGAAATSNGSSAFVAGGFSRELNSDLNQFRRYDLTSNTWTTLAPMLDHNFLASAVYSPINNKVYVFGGEDYIADVGPEINNLTRIYDIATNTWSNGAPMPAAAILMASGYYNGKIYLVGGHLSGPNGSQVWEYDPVANTWNTSRAPIPHGIGSAGFGVINGHLYVAGGFSNPPPPYNGLFDYDIAANTWTQRANLLTPVDNPGSAVMGGQLWLFGGETGNNLDNSNTSQFYDVASDTWSSGSKLGIARSFIGGTAIGNSLFATGGTSSFTTSFRTTEVSVCTDCAFFENFDGVVAPQLPLGWVATGNPAPLWVTSTTSPNTPPNDAFVDDPAVISNKYLDTPVIAVPPISAQVSFRNFYDLQSGFDGGVLEVSSPNINGGTFTDITSAAVGGNFLSGGYNATISNAFGSPIAGRMAWTGSSGGYLNTVANLGPNVAGKPIKLRFHMASDNGVSGIGWRLDHFALTPVSCAPTLLTAISRKTHNMSGTFDVELPLTGSIGVECRQGSGMSLDGHLVIATFANPVAIGGLIIGSSDGLATGSISMAGSVVTINLSSVADNQAVNITFMDASDGISSGSVAIPMGVLRGDSSGNGSVNSADIGQTKFRSGQILDGSNFRSDVDASGSINATDTSIVKSNSGAGLP